MRTPKSSSKRRKVSVWRILLSGIATFCAYFSLSHTIANVIEPKAPGLAHRLAPFDGRIEAADALSNFNAAPTARSENPVVRKAIDALRRDPTAVDALNVLAFQAQMRGDAEYARDLFNYSLKLSRRELRSQLWAVEEAVSRGDIANALENYDIAFRTSSGAQNLLFPILAKALAEPLVRARFIQILLGKPVWTESFLQYAAANSPNPDAIRLLFEEIQARGLEVADVSRVELVNSLVRAGEYRSAWDYYSELRDGSQRSRSRDPEFTFAGQNRTVFDWIPSQYTTITPRTASTSGQAEFSVPPAVGSRLLEQYLMLPPGKYRLVGQSSGVSASKDARPSWVVQCFGGRELIKISLDESSEAPRRFAGEISVGSDCSMQLLTLVARPTDDISGIVGNIDSVSLEPVRP